MIIFLKKHPTDSEVSFWSKWNVLHEWEPIRGQLDRNELARILEDNHFSGRSCKIAIFWQIFQDNHLSARSGKIDSFCKILAESCKITIWSRLGFIIDIEIMSKMKITFFLCLLLSYRCGYILQITKKS